MGLSRADRRESLQRRPCLFVVTLLALVACGAPPPEVTSQSGTALSPSPNDQAAFDYFIGKGLANFQAAGIVGNLDQESQVDPGAEQQGGPGRGIAQWSVGGRWDTDANDNVIGYAATQGASSASLTLQLEFIWYELTTFSGYGLSELRASTNVTDATVAFETYYEGCGQCDQSNRIADAQAALNAYGAIDYAAAYVSQSFPLASSALTMVAGETIPSYIELKNTGVKTWDSSTHLGTSNPRDRVSVFAASDWLSTSRPAGVSGTVAPGASFKFTFDLHAPAKTGTYFEYFNLVQEGVAWFSDPGQGGPADDDLEVQIVVVAAPPLKVVADGGVKSGGGTEDGGTGAGGGTNEDGGIDPAAGDDGGGGGFANAGGPAATPPSDDDGGAPANGAGSNGSGTSAGSCTMSRAPTPSGSWSWIVAAGVFGLLARRRSRDAE